jgi:cell fate (sporulation/competence/biofilm development) regulator YlbF (YheA/YmcA/DUF963 family)
LNEIEIVPPSVVWHAVNDFASALAETSQFKAFEQADLQLRQDANAQQALSIYHEKWRSLEALIRLNALSIEDQQELERLRQAYLVNTTVNAYAQARMDLAPLCQAAGKMISQATGLNFPAVCSSGCCG